MLRERDSRYDDRFHAQEKALDKALAANDKRLDSMNEFRASMSDLSGRMVMRTESEVQRKATENKIDDLSGRLTEKFDDLAQRVKAVESAQVGRKEGFGTSGNLVLGLISFVALLVAVIAVWERH